MSTYSKSTNYRKIYEQNYGPIPKDGQGRTFEIHHIDGNHNNNDPLNLVAVSIEDHYNIHYEQEDWAACLLMSDRMKISPEEKSDLSRRTQLTLVLNGTHHWLDPEFIERNISRQHNLMSIGEHNFQREDVKLKTKIIVKETQLLRFSMGVHQFQDPIVREKAKITLKEVNDKLVSEGKHIFQNTEKRTEWLTKQFAEGRHPTQNGELQRQKTMSQIEKGTHLWIQEGYQTELNYRMIAEGRHASQKKIHCPHCELVVDAPNFKRWHGDNCKKNPIK